MYPTPLRYLPAVATGRGPRVWKNASRGYSHLEYLETHDTSPLSPAILLLSELSPNSSVRSSVRMLKHTAQGSTVLSRRSKQAGQTT